jgi:hypothetical protein
VGGGMGCGEMVWRESRTLVGWIAYRHDPEFRERPGVDWIT